MSGPLPQSRCPRSRRGRRRPGTRRGRRQIATPCVLADRDPDVIGIDEPQVHAGLPGRGDHRSSSTGHPREHGVEERLVHHLDPAGAEVLGQATRGTCTAAAISERPWGPWYTAYMLAVTASSTCAVQMFEVAFSRRMCCSRVCSASRYAGVPSTSLDTPTRRPGSERSSLARTEMNPRAVRRRRAAPRTAGWSRRRCRRPTPPAE